MNKKLEGGDLNYSEIAFNANSFNQSKKSPNGYGNLVTGTNSADFNPSQRMITSKEVDSMTQAK